MSGTPLTDTEFAGLLEPLAPAGPLAVAVSGGCDSTALLVLAARWAKARGRRLVAATVDHALRPESAQEAQRVAGQAAALGVAHTILARTEPLARGNLEAAARTARYTQLAEFCRAHGVAALLVAHTLDDQAETVLMRLARGSGVDGLAAMAPATTLMGMRVLRPLLAVPRARLAATLAAFGMTWLEDPMNGDDRFVRVRLRKAQVVLAGAGLTPRRLAATAKAMARARVALEAVTSTLLGTAAHVDPAGFCRLEPAALAAAPDDVALRALARVVAAVGGAAHTPRLERLERLLGHIRQGSLGRGRTLGGCRIVPSAGDFLVVRETGLMAADPLRLDPGTERLWDGRFMVRLEGDACAAGHALAVKALGPAGWAMVKASRPPQSLPALPAVVRPTLPSLWAGDALVAAPHLGFARSGVAEAFSATFLGA